MTCDQDYDELLSKARSDPGTADFQALRWAYARSSRYDPYAPGGSRLSLGPVVPDAGAEAAMRAVDQMLEFNYLDIHAHLLAASLHTCMGDRSRADYHRRFGGGLLQSVLKSGDGRSHRTAFVVISMAEEYAVLGSLGLEMRTQALVEHGGHFFDRMEAYRRSTGEISTLYFNTDVIHAWLGRQLEVGPEK